MRPAIVITGASSGLGREFVRVAAGESAAVVLVARSEKDLTALARDIDPAGVRAYALCLDLTRREAGAELEEFLARRDLYCDILVNNAGCGLFGEATRLDRGAQLGIVDLNVRAATDLALRVLPGMVARGRGHVLNVSSTAAFYPGPRMALYYASKAYLLSMSEALWRETRGTGVTVTCLCPGPIKTPFFSRAEAGEVALFKLLPKLETSAVAHAGWQAMKAGRRLCVPGLINKMIVACARIVPRRAALEIASRLLRNRVPAGGS